MKLVTDRFVGLNMVQKMIVEEANFTPIKEFIDTEKAGQIFDFKPIGFGVFEGIKDKDTKQEEEFVVLAVQLEDGNIFSVGSENFRSKFIGYFDSLEKVNEDWYLQAYTGDSKRFKGKTFVSCRLKDGKIPHVSSDTI